MNKWTVIFVVGLMTIANVIKADLQEAEIQRRLKQLNKPALKSIHSSNGDIFDCVNIYDQPAFDHPLLKNHTIQMEPSSYPKRLSKGKEAYSNSDERPATRQLWPKNKKCPKNTVPIKRTTREDLIRADLMKKLRRNIQIINGTKTPYSTDGHEYAIMSVNGQFNGANAHMNLWKPNVRARNEFSVAQIWVKSGSSDPVSVLEAGWQVYPQSFGDANPKLFVYYTGDSYRTGCYNTDCPGFVYVHREIRLGETLQPVSTYGGLQQEMFAQIWKDYRNGNWWVRVGETNVGYWPSSVIPGLSNYATTLQWGGEILNLLADKHTTTEMGSGHFGEEGFGRSAFFTHLETVDTTNTQNDPQGLQTFMTNSNCYNLIPSQSAALGFFFYYGGPGRNPRCP